MERWKAVCIQAPFLLGQIFTHRPRLSAAWQRFAQGSREQAVRSPWSPIRSDGWSYWCRAITPLIFEWLLLVLYLDKLLCCDVRKEWGMSVKPLQTLFLRSLWGWGDEPGSKSGRMFIWSVCALILSQQCRSVRRSTASSKNLVNKIIVSCTQGCM